MWDVNVEMRRSVRGCNCDGRGWKGKGGYRYEKFVMAGLGRVGVLNENKLACGSMSFFCSASINCFKVSDTSKAFEGVSSLDRYEKKGLVNLLH